MSAVARRLRAPGTTESFTARDVQRRAWAGLADRDTVAAAIELLDAQKGSVKMLRVFAALLFLVSAIAAVGAAERPGLSVITSRPALTECQVALLLASALTHGSQRCGVFPGTQKVVDNAFTCAASLSIDEVNVLVGGRQVYFLNDLDRLGAQATCDLLSDALTKNINPQK